MTTVVGDHNHPSEAVPQPLAGMRVIEISSFVASPLGGMTLAQLGADVIRIDPIGGGADRNRWPVAPSGTSLYWADLNKGKRSITVDLRSDDGKELVADLVGSSGDGGGIVLTNARPRAGLTYEDLRETRPDLIHLRLKGSRDGSTAVDYTVNASTGFPLVTGPTEHNGPVNHVMPVWDVTTGLYIAVGLLAAERHRHRTGEGQALEIALEDVAIATAGNLGYLAEAELTSESRPRIGNQVYGDFGTSFTTHDGEYVMLLVLTARHWRDLTEALGIGPAIGELERCLGADFTRGEDRYLHRDLLVGLIAPWFRTHTYAETEARLKESSVLWSRYRSFQELTERDGPLVNNPLMNRIDQPGVGPYLSPGAPLQLDGAQLPSVPAPTLGEHTDALLSEMLEYGPHEIRSLHDRGIVG